MAGVTLCEPTELYNLLNQSTKISRLAEPNYLCLLDARTKREYNESHLMTALRVKTNPLGKYLVPESINLECVRYCVVYDGKTETVDAAFDMDYDLLEVDTELTRIIPLFLKTKKAGIMQRLTRFPVMVLRGGYERFTTSYHYLRTQKIFWMPQELEAFKTYPVEILPAKLYMGNYKQACDSQIQKDLKIKAHINISDPLFFPSFLEDREKLLHIPIPDSLEADLFSHFVNICHFIGKCLGLFSNIFPAPDLLYLSSQNAWNFAQKCKNNIRPNRAFVKQLSDWEQRFYITAITDISEPNY
uniref:Tyrosine-protein phosphatase domain-containing protein n=1 Tax=Pseudonaja textilis TaxID=8673 RepID=A0A670Y752_PSETE